VLKMLQELTCQANGPVSVVSDGTVYDLDLEHPASSSWI
jgi:predicted heme/steroid binding protein